MRRLDFLAGLVAGAGLMYVLDPERGRRRRALVRDQVIHAERKLAGEGAAGTRDLFNRSRGMLASLRSRMDADVEDVVLEERVRAALGRAVRHSAIEVHAEDGVVTLTGPVLAEDVDRLVDRIWRVPGVQGLVNEMEVHSSRHDTQRQQGEDAFPQEGSGRREPPPSVRLLMALAGAALAYAGLRIRGTAGMATGFLGGTLIARSLTSMESRRIFGLSGRRGVDFHKTVTIAAPIDRVFELWADFENFPRFMSNVHEVRQIGQKRSHWTVSGPLGTPVQWIAAITRYEPPELLAWRTEAGSTVQHAGIVQFEPVDEASTRVTVRLSYNPGAGVLGHAVAALFHADPKVQMDEDLMRMKSFIETGVPPGDARQPAPEPQHAGVRSRRSRQQREQGDYGEETAMARQGTADELRKESAPGGLPASSEDSESLPPD